METLNVDLGTRSYPIHVGPGLLARADALLPDTMGADVLVVSNTTVAPLYLDRLLNAFGDRRVVSHLLPDGEQHKTLDEVAGIVTTALEAGFSRDATFIALGGGVVGDMTGFAAAVFMRGVRCVQIPTTLLAQVDSSVGGKTGVNHRLGKNLIGAFHQPSCVLIDTDTLDSLPPREFAAGMAEVIKHGAIADLAYFEMLERQQEALVSRESDALGQAIAQSCRIKAAVVAEDERERGRRAILNFGHTFGHAIEACTGYTRWLHGEAVALGMLMAAEMSDLEPVSQARLRDLIVAMGLPTEPGSLATASMLKAMGHDKKVQAGSLTLILLSGLGEAYISRDFDDARLKSVLDAWST
ncbi:MAG: 3-dehydroquinate synthase [Pseudomonadota bacterium]